MQEGSIRADVNLSMRPAGQKEFGTRTEMKNLNSFKAISRAIECESKRQIELIEEGGRIVQETRRWDDNKDASYAMRSKENAQDYRYFPEPDLPPVELSDAYLAEIKGSLPEMAQQKQRRYVEEFGIPEYDARMITTQKPLAVFFERTAALCNRPKEVSNWIMGDLMRLLKDTGTEAREMKLTPETLTQLISLVEQGSINRRSAREIFAEAFQNPVDVDEYIRAHGMEQVSDSNLVQEAVDKAFTENPQSIADYFGGKTKAYAFLVGQSMRLLKGKADPAVVNEAVTQKLDSLR